jgi:hypothetical protein
LLVTILVATGGNMPGVDGFVLQRHHAIGIDAGLNQGNLVALEIGPKCSMAIKAAICDEPPKRAVPIILPFKSSARRIAGN